MNTTKNSTDDVMDIHARYHLILMTWLILLLLVNIGGVFGSILTLTATLTFPTLRKSSSCILLAHSIVVDSICSTLVFPATAVMCYLHYPTSSDDPSTWRYLASVRFILQYANYWSHCTLAIHRFLTMAFTHHSSFHRSHKAIGTLLVLPWGFAIIVNMAPTFNLLHARYLPSVPWGGFTIGPQKSSLLSAVFGVHVPGTIMGFCYILGIIHAGNALQNRKRRIGYGANSESLSSTQMMKTVRRRWEISKVLFLTFVWFLICTYPVPIVSLFYPTTMMTHHLLTLWLRFPQYSYVGLTPMIFLLSSPMYRDAVRTILKQWLAIIHCGPRSTIAVYVSSNTTQGAARYVL